MKISLCRIHPLFNYCYVGLLSRTAIAARRIVNKWPWIMKVYTVLVGLWRSQRAVQGPDNAQLLLFSVRMSNVSCWRSTIRFPAGLHCGCSAIMVSRGQHRFLTKPDDTHWHIASEIHWYSVYAVISSHPSPVSVLSSVGFLNVGCYRFEHSDLIGVFWSSFQGYVACAFVFFL